MGQFSDNEWFEIEHCCNCGMAFAMTTDFQKRRLKDRKSFYCPSGHGQHYTGRSEAQKLRAELRRANNRADEMQQQAAKEGQRAASISRSYKRVRDRVKNGVCPCCNRTFDNLARHMKTKHEDYGNNQQLRTMRLAYGLSQRQLATEIGISANYVSLYERGMELPRSSSSKLDEWVSAQSA